MADVAIWSRLPPVLLPIIIENTTDIPTLEAWCQSTRHSSYLHRIAKRETYRTFRIGRRAFVKSAPSSIAQIRAIGPDGTRLDHVDETEHGFNIAQADASIPLSEFYRENASFVRRLVLDLDFVGLERAEDLVATPGTKGFDSIWGDFLSQASCLDEVEHCGFLNQSMLDRLADMQNLRVLKLRESDTRTGKFSRLRRTDIQAFMSSPSRDLLLSWSKLIRLQFLRTLHISNLFHREAFELGLTLQNLPTLKDLRVAVSSLSSPGANTIKSDDPSPLMELLKGLNLLRPEIAPSPGFPASLEKLALVDFYSHLTATSLQGLASIRPLENLTHLHLDFLISSAIVRMIDILNPHNLTHLSLSTVLTTGSPSSWMRFEEVLARHRDTLQQITLVNAWLNFLPFSPNIDPPWSSFMEPAQLYLARHPKASFFTHTDHLHWCIFGNLDRMSKWGAGIRHVCIDQVDLKHLRIDRIDHPDDGLRHLRVLILRPLLRQLNTHQNNTPIASLSHPPDPPLPTAMDSLPETAIAKIIAAQALPYLRLIAIGPYRYWIQSPDDNATTTTTGSRKVWFLQAALQDPLQEGKISQALDADDWAFLAYDRSNSLAESAPDELVRLANRLVYRPIRD